MEPPMDADEHRWVKVLSLRVDQRDSAAPSSCGTAFLACSLSDGQLYMYLVNDRRGGAPKTTGQIQNPQDFFEAGIAEVPPKNCSNSGLEFGARV
jgi:hypothetical protein